MSTSKETMADFLDALAPLDVRARAMFGEYGVYCDEKFIAVVCDDRFFLKPTAAADSLAAELESSPPYPGAKDYLVLDARFMRDRGQLRRLVQATADVLPVPKPKKARAPRKKKARAPRKKA